MRLAVRGAWVAHNIRQLGNGSFYHLSYATHQVHPELLEKLRHARMKQSKVKVYVLRDGKGFLVADGEIVAIHWFPEFIRIHFMINGVFVEEIGEVISWHDAEHLLLP